MRVLILTNRRFLHHAPGRIVGELRGEISALAEQKKAALATLRKDDQTVIGKITPDMVIGGMRGIKGLLTETSDLHADEGIRYRGLTLSELNAALPKAREAGGGVGEVGLPEAAFWQLLTGKIPSESQTQEFTKELHSRAQTLPQQTYSLVDSFPSSMHPMTQLAMGVLALQPESQFARAYARGMKKQEYWEKALEDTLNLIAWMPPLAARIYRNTYHGRKHVQYDASLDWAGNYAHMLGVSKDFRFREVTRLYLTLHADHEGGNVSAHTTHLVGSALSDPFYAWAAGITGLAGPLHGLANQECLKWLEEANAWLNGREPTVPLITEYTKTTLSQGKVVPGYGHAVLRKTDPRFLLEREFALKHMKTDPMVRLVDVCFQAIPPVLEATGKVKNPWPNVDAHSGVCMKHYGLSEPDYYTVVFAVSRAIGVSAQYVWSRLYNLPIERPKSVTLDSLAKARAAAETK